MTEMVHYLL